MNAQGFITARYGNRTVECPVELVAQLQRERQQQTGDRDSLLAFAEAIKANATKYIREIEPSG